MSIIVIERVSEIRDWVSTQKASTAAVIGFVPTMGALHPGHISLINKAKQSCDRVVVSIFVNPIQFNNPDDLKRYPRTFERDKAMLEAANCDVIFFPSVEEMYPIPEKEHWDFGLLSNTLEAAHRPGHFDGVLTVVKKLFQIVGPDKAFFGEKDFQQLSLIRKMALYENIPVEVSGAPLIRETDGLAMSSRNMRLDVEQRIKANALSQALFRMKNMERSMEPQSLIRFGEKLLTQSDGVELEYLAIVESETFVPVNSWQNVHQPIALLAAVVGGVRLIDNIFL